MSVEKIKISVIAFSIFSVLAMIFHSPVKAIMLDKETIDCLSCHDASIASDATIVTVCGLPDCDHPIGVNYVWAAAQNPGLRAPVYLNPNIRLVEGSSVGCGTCHVPYNYDDHSALSTQRALYPDIADPMLVMDNRRSELCLACHIK